MKWACPSTSSCPFAARPKRSIATRGEPHAYARRIVRKAALQIGVHRHVGRRDHRLKMREREVARDRVVGIGLPKGKARARGGQASLPHLLHRMSRRQNGSGKIRSLHGAREEVICRASRSMWTKDAHPALATSISHSGASPSVRSYRVGRDREIELAKRTISWGAYAGYLSAPFATSS